MLNQKISLSLNNRTVEKWDIFELNLEGPKSENPFSQVTLAAEFIHQDKKITVNGFFSGNSKYCIRFMPDLVGEWKFKTNSNIKELDSVKGSFMCSPPVSENHGPVEVSHQYHFAYADGKPYYPFGTTSYGWVHQQDQLAAQTLNSLSKSPFNKIRMCLLPHYSDFSAANITCFPFMGNPDSGWDFTRLNPDYFLVVDQRIEALKDLGIEADLILFHPYNKPWGFDAMPASADDLYVEYVVRRYSAYRNVWWSLANEYDMIDTKNRQDWYRYGRLIKENDPYGHLISNHNYEKLFEYWEPWITHACIQDGLAVSEKGRSIALRNAYMKPVIYDEVCYEGNFNMRWGDLTAKELIHRYWQGITGGTFVGHGEVLRGPNETDDHVWTGIGGPLHGQSISRIAFLRRLVEENPGNGLNPVDKCWYTNIVGSENKYFLIYLGNEKLETWPFSIPIKGIGLNEGDEFKVDIIDTWNMTISESTETFIIKKNQYEYVDIYKRSVELPCKPGMAVRIRSV